MKKVLAFSYAIFLLFFAFVPKAFAVSSTITSYTSDTLQMITLIASSAAAFFLVKGGYLYFTSAGRPDALEDAKKTIRQALIGLVIVLASGLIISVFQNALTGSPDNTNSSSINLTPINTQTPSDGLTQVLIDAVTGFIQNIIESAVQPIITAIIGFLTTTPNLLTNTTVFNFWLISLGIVDSLFVLVVAILGLHVMSASSFGFEEVELKQLLPRIGLAFLGANISLFLANYMIVTCNALVTEVLNTTGGLTHAWVLNAINLPALLTKTTPLITLVFLLIFLIISIVLLFMYIARLIAVSLGAVLAPFIFLLWAIPKFSDFAEVAVKGYIVSVFTIFVHVVVIQLASSFLALPESSTNSLLSVVIAIGLFITLLKIPGMLFQMIFYTSRASTFKKLGGQIMNVMTTDNQSSDTRILAKKRKVVAA